MAEEKIICRSCNEELTSKKKLIFHILKLECFDENLEWKNSGAKNGRNKN